MVLPKSLLTKESHWTSRTCKERNTYIYYRIVCTTIQPHFMYMRRMTPAWWKGIPARIIVTCSIRDRLCDHHVSLRFHFWTIKIPSHSGIHGTKLNSLSSHLFWVFGNKFYYVCFFIPLKFDLIATYEQQMETICTTRKN